jgi:hypothetical protein
MNGNYANDSVPDPSTALQDVQGEHKHDWAFESLHRSQSVAAEELSHFKPPSWSLWPTYGRRPIKKHLLSDSKPMRLMERMFAYVYGKLTNQASLAVSFAEIW